MLGHGRADNPGTWGREPFCGRRIFYPCEYLRGGGALLGGAGPLNGYDGASPPLSVLAPRFGGRGSVVVVRVVVYPLVLRSVATPHGR